MVAAWNQGAGSTAYTSGTAADLTVSPAGATAVWAISAPDSGIRYTNGANTGFFPLPVTVNAVPTILTQPANQSISLGQTATFTVAVQNGTAPYTYQWQEDTGSGFTDIVCATAAAYTTPAATLVMNGYTYRCIVTDAHAVTATSDGAATLTVQNTAKAITSFTLAGAPRTINEAAGTIAVTVPYGTNVTNLVATFAHTGDSIAVGGVNQISGTTPNDFTSPVTYTVTAADSSAKNYIVTVSVEANSNNNIGGGTWNPPSPFISSVTFTHNPDGSVTLNINASGTGLRFQWQVRGSWIDIPGATTATYTYTGLTIGKQ